MMFYGKEHFKIRVILSEQIILRTKPDTEYFQRLHARNGWSKTVLNTLIPVEMLEKNFLTCILTDGKTQCSHTLQTVIIISDITRRQRNW